MKTTLLVIAVALLAVPAGAADMPLKIKPSGAVNIHAYGDNNPSCSVWTDGCRRCDRASGTPSCSNIGIACQPGLVRCETESTPAK
jgi:hypothetical protein